MRFLTALWFLLAGWLRKPMLLLVRYRVAPEDVKNRLNLDPLRPVCYVLPQRSWSDLFVLDRICDKQNLPRPKRLGYDLPTVQKPGYLYLSVLLESRTEKGRARGADVTGLVQRAVTAPDYDVQLVPVSLFWGREPEKETSLFKLVFADAPGAGALRKLFIILFNGRNVLASFGLPLAFRAYLSDTAGAAETRTPALAHDTSQRALHKLTRVLHFHFLRSRTATLGPSLLRRGVVIDGLLASTGVKLAIEREAKQKGQTLEQVQKRTRRMAEEIAADYSNTAIRFMSRVVGFIFTRVFKGLETRGLERVRELAQGQELVYLPAHRSHADYLLLSYVLYNAGLFPPHIAAGININLPFGIGALLRRGGAFYMRRSFSGDRLYTALFRTYMDSLIQRGYPIEFFPEGGRSRTGRLMAPKTGLMSMMVESALRQRVRRVLVVPLHIGYDKVWEINSYLKELRGAGKEKESVQGLLKATRMLVKSYGKAYLNFGEPIRLDEFADRHLPGWREAMAPDSDTRPEGFSKMVSELALETMRRVNSAAVVTPSGLLGAALLASPQKAAAESDLIEQLGLLLALLQGRPYGPDQHIPVTDPKEVLAWSEPINGTSRIQHPWGDLILAEQKAAVRMTYARNNIVHLFALPSLIANFFRTRYGQPEESLVSGCKALYPFLGAQFFLRWSAAECEPVVLEWIEVMVRL
ncbi:MAG: glycerol-3-phosphate 1-O-acyltransferase PlsB, partial [Hydrocarboniphaga effusa]|nr:glycerol-3-phosphate 1-O-acyltransferase PlsB [Hydrocarboniphaga effusa]